MSDWQRSTAVLGVAFAGVGLTTMLLAFAIAGGPSTSTSPQPGESPSSGTDGPAEPLATTGIGGALTITGDRTDTFVLDRDAIDDLGYALAGPEGRIQFTGHPATISRLLFDGLEFYLDPSTCAYAPGERDEATGLAPVEVTCDDIGDVRDTATISVAGTLRLPADQAGVRGDLPATGGQVIVGDEEVTFEEASLDLRRPELIERRPGFTTRHPVVYPVTISGADAVLEFEIDVNVPDLRLMAITLGERHGEVVGDGCQIAYQRLAELSPRVSVVEMTLDCPEVDMDGAGIVAMNGSLVVDIAYFSAHGLR